MVRDDDALSLDKHRMPEVAVGPKELSLGVELSPESERQVQLEVDKRLEKNRILDELGAIGPIAAFKDAHGRVHQQEAIENPEMWNAISDTEKIETLQRAANGYAQNLGRAYPLSIHGAPKEEPRVGFEPHYRSISFTKDDLQTLPNALERYHRGEAQYTAFAIACGEQKAASLDTARALKEGNRTLDWPMERTDELQQPENQIVKTQEAIVTWMMVRHEVQWRKNGHSV